MRKLLLLLLFIPFAVAAVQECPRFGTITEDIPCIQPSSWNPGNCTAHNATLYDSGGDIVLNASYYPYSPYCAFNVTGLDEPDVYCYNSTINDGCITLAREDNMLSIILVQIGLVIFFIALGLPFRFGFAKFASWSLALLEIVMTVWMVWIAELGKSITVYLYINGMITLIFGGILGFMAVLAVMVKLSKGDENELADDGYTKFIYGK